MRDHGSGSEGIHTKPLESNVQAKPLLLYCRCFSIIYVPGGVGVQLGCVFSWVGRTKGGPVVTTDYFYYFHG